MMPIPTLACAFLALTSTQTPATNPAPPASDWKEVDRVVAIVNQDIVTLFQLLRDLNRELKLRPVKDKSELQNLQTEILTARVKLLLSKQAGQDLGADPKLVDRNVQDRFDAYVAGQNGAAGLSKLLQFRDVTTQDLKQSIRETLYSSLWEDLVTGEGSGLSERPIRDLYVRPGQMQFRFDRALREPVTLGQLGGSVDSVTFQTLVLAADANGGLEATLRLAREYKQAIEAGSADMNELVRKHGHVKQADGVGAALELSGLRAQLPAAASFVDARPADVTRWPRYVSEPIVTGKPGSSQFVQIFRIQSFTPGHVPDFGSAQTQAAIVRIVRRDLDEYRLEHAYTKLFDAAYVWPEEYAPRNRR